MKTAQTADLLDRPMPQSAEAERAVIGAIVIDFRAYERAKKLVTVADFFKDSHRAILGVIDDLVESGVREVDLLTIKNELARRGKLDEVGGAAYVSALIDNIPDVANVERYAEIVHEKARLRELIVIGNRLMRRAIDSGGESAEQIAAEELAKLEAIHANASDSALLPLERIAPEIARLYIDGGLPAGWPTGWRCMEPYYSVAPGAFTLVTGIPGHGKSGWLDHLTLHLARFGDRQIVMFSAENYPSEAHVASIIEKLVGMPFNEGPTTRMRPADVERGLSFVAKHFRFIDPAAEHMTVDRILKLASAMAEKRPIDALVIDPWNELQHDYDEKRGMTETRYISEMITRMKRWAWRHNAHVFVVAHPKQMQKDKDGKYPVPTPYDVSGGANWRNKADYCLCVYRELADGEDDPAVTIYVQKVRRRNIGKIGAVTLHYDKVTGEYNDPTVPRKRYEYAD